MPRAASKSPGRVRRVHLFRNGRNQALRIPKEFEMPGTEVLLVEEEGGLRIQPLPRSEGLLDVLSRLQPLDESWPNTDARLPHLDDVRL